MIFNVAVVNYTNNHVTDQDYMQPVFLKWRRQFTRYSFKIKVERISINKCRINMYSISVNLLSTVHTNRVSITVNSFPTFLIQKPYA